MPALANPLGEAGIFYRKGNFEGALAKYQEILKDNPKSPDAYAGEVRVYLKQKNVESAAQAVEEGLAQVNSPRIKVAQAEVWFRQGKISEAEKLWVEVIKSGYPEARAFLGLARVRDAIAMYKSAKKMVDKAHELDPYDPDIQEQWIGTLSRSERIRYLETSLAGENNWDADQRSDAANYLQYLKERSKQKNSFCRLVSNVTHTETPLTRLLIDPQHIRGYGLTVAVNGHKNSLMLDTGASGILVKRSIAERAGISKLSETKVWGIGNKGRRNGYVGIADSIKIGELEFQNCPIEVMESRSVADEDGLIGADVFEDFLVDIDFPEEKLKLSDLPRRPGEPDAKLALKSEDGDSDDASSADNPKSADAKTPAPVPGPQDRYIAPEMQSYSHVFRFGHDLLVPTSIGNVPNKLFVMDTGAMFNAISPSAAREVTKVHTDGDMIVKGISGRVDKVYSANKAVLQFGNLRQENQDMTAFDTKPISDGVGTEVSGFLGFVMLRFLDIKIDYRDALISFQYDAKRWNR
ncbi:MAG TPA: aspartyl protease family protein [Candidatus Sulfotelmatobacter sp.]|nr:aspartyl protease family protein [Candidatus Sulfotelmatobacter sp.]